MTYQRSRIHLYPFYFEDATTILFEGHHIHSIVTLNDELGKLIIWLNEINYL